MHVLACTRKWVNTEWVSEAVLCNLYGTDIVMQLGPDAVM